MSTSGEDGSLSSKRSPKTPLIQVPIDMATENIYSIVLVNLTVRKYSFCVRRRIQSKNMIFGTRKACVSRSNLLISSLHSYDMNMCC